MTMPLHDALDPLLLETLEEGVVEFIGNRVLRANPAFARLVGLAVEKLEGRNASDFFADADGRPLASTQLQQATRLRDASGSLCPVAVRRVSADRVVVVDRSREQRLEQQIWQLSSRLQSQAGVESEPVLCDEVSSMVEHEIRTSSTVVRGYLRMLLDGRPGPLTGEQAGFLREARREIERIESLVDDLLDLAASEGPRELRVALKPARLHPVINQAVATAHPLLHSRGLAVGVDLAPADAAAGWPRSESTVDEPGSPRASPVPLEGSGEASSARRNPQVRSVTCWASFAISCFEGGDEGWTIRQWHPRVVARI